MLENNFVNKYCAHIPMYILCLCMNSLKETHVNPFYIVKKLNVKNMPFQNVMTLESSDMLHYQVAKPIYLMQRSPIPILNT